MDLTASINLASHIPYYIQLMELLKDQAGADIRQQSPLNRVARPEEIAHAILMLSDEKSEFMTGAILDVNGASYLRT